MQRVLTIYYDDESMELTQVDIAPAFESVNPLDRVDVLQDCVEAIVDLYHQIMEDLPMWQQAQIRRT